MHIKKLCLGLMIMILLVGTISALNIDDKTDYNEIEREYTLTNFFGWGKEIAKIKLNSGNTESVAVGYGKVAEFEITNGEFDYENIIDGIELYYIDRNMRKFDRVVDYKYKTQKEVDAFTLICPANNDTGKEVCIEKKIGTKFVEDWVDFKSNSLAKQEVITIGIFTEVKPLDSVEWIINIYGEKRLIEWAIWNATTEAHGLDMRSGSHNVDAGLDIYTHQNITILNVTKYAGDASIYAKIKVTGTPDGCIDGTEIASEAFVGDVATFDFELNGSSLYSICGSTNGSTQTFYFNDTSHGLFPINDTTLDWLGGEYEGSRIISVGVKWEVGTAPTITLNSPEDTYNSTLKDLTFNCSAYDDSAIVNVSLLINGTIKQTNASGINNTNYIFSETLTDGTGSYNWSCQAYDDADASTIADARNLTYTNELTVSLNSPVNAYNSSSSNITFNGTASDDTAIINVSLIIDGVYNETNTSGINNTNYLFTKSLIDGDYNWTYDACDIYTCENATTRNLTIDTTPPIVNDAENITDLVVYSLPVNSTWNYTVTDDHIGSCYYNTTENATLTVITCNASEDTTWTTGGNKTIQYCANDTFGWETCKEAYVYVYSISYTQAEDLDPVGEGVNVTFNLNVSLTDIPTTTATLMLKDIYYTADSTTSTTDYYFFEKTITIPDGYGNTTGLPQLWFWNYTISGVTTNASTSDTNVTVYEMAIDDCSTYGEVILNLTLNDEEDNSEINGSLGSNIEIDLLLTSIDNSSLTWTYNNTWVNDSNVAVCIPSHILNNSEYDIEFDIGFDSTDRVWEFYFLDNGTLNSTKSFNSLTDYTIDLMDLLTTDSTSFLFNYFDEDGLPVDDIIVHTFRKYIGEGTFREIERSQADQNGDTIVHLVEEDVIYYFIISQYGVILYTSSDYNALCQDTPCIIQLEAGGEVAEFGTDWDLIDSGSYDISSDFDTRIVTLNYSLTESAIMNLTVYQYDDDGDVSVISSNQSTGTEDTLTVFVPLSAGNISFFSTLYQDGDFVNSEWIDFEDDPQGHFGITLSLFLASLIILCLGLMAVTEGVGTIVMVILGVAITGFLGLINVGLSTGINIVVYLILAGGILLWKLTGGRK